MIAGYSLSDSPASFNFIEFLVAATTNGVDQIVFDLSQGAKKFKGLELEERIHSILIPACKIAGVAWSFGKCDWYPPYHMSAVLDAYKKHGFIKKLRSESKGGARATVTLRNYERHPEKNSSEEWRKFANRIGALVIEDYYDRPISLEERFSLYAGAEMNYFGQNGPLALCLFSDYPYTAYIPAKGRWEVYHKEHGWYRNQLPWANEKQKVIWSEFSSATTSAKV